MIRDGRQLGLRHFPGHGGRQVAVIGSVGAGPRGERGYQGEECNEDSSGTHEANIRRNRDNPTKNRIFAAGFKRIGPMTRFKAALFDLDGVIFDTEPQYTRFWGSEFRRYYPDRPGLEDAIKGQTLTQIYDKWFSGPLEAEREGLTARLDAFEAQMDFPYVEGTVAFIRALREMGLRTAVVTSSNQPKMSNVFRTRPEFTALFDRIVTAEDITRSKPAPDCYLKAAELLGTDPTDCIAFEDSFNGLRSALAAGTTVVALTTAHPAAEVMDLSHFQIPDYTDALGLLGLR